MRGRIDAIYEAGESHWEIVDFKSGRRSNDPASLVQLEAYAVAAAEVPFTSKRPETIDVTFAYLGGGLDLHTDRADAEWVDNARRHLASLLDGIAARHWEPSPSQACRSCDFLRFCDPGRSWLDAAAGSANSPD